jgi:hypothetical protein
VSSIKRILAHAGDFGTFPMKDDGVREEFQDLVTPYVDRSPQEVSGYVTPEMQETGFIATRRG